MLFVAAKRRGQRGSNISWCQALGRVFWSGVVSGNSTSTGQPSNPVRNVGERNNCRRGGNIESDTVAVSSTLLLYRLLLPALIQVEASSILALSYNLVSSILGGGNGDIAEEKTESQVPVGTDDM